MDIVSIQDTARDIVETLPCRVPDCTLILGSGWSRVIDDVDPLTIVNYRDIPMLGAPQVSGHPGQLVVAAHANATLLIFAGRRHWYEGGGWLPVALPVFIAAAAGCRDLVLTNAAGGVNPAFRPGDIMVIDDHINAMGANPLHGAKGSRPWPRFPDMTTVYDPGRRALADRCASHLTRPVHHGVYAATPGPVYETPAEIAAFRATGVDAVGMSTVPEAMLGHAMGLRVVALSCITNMAAGISGDHLSHDDVIRQTEDSYPAMRDLLLGLTAAIAGDDTTS